MSQTAIPNEFAKYMQNQISVGLAPDMNEMIFAYIPDLDPSQPIDLTQGLPSVGTWVHQQDIDQLGKLGDNALVYSTIIENDKEFTFNAIYLRDKNVPNSCGMVVHKAEETKELGSTLTRSLMMEYVNAAQIVGVIDDAATWQIDYQARLKGIEEDHRLACLDNYGHTAFVDGFDVTQQADPNKYKITPGVVYVGGLRAVLANEVLQTITTKPNGIYIDVVRDGTALSAWENTLTIKVSTTTLNDYADEFGRNHYVAKLAGINADGSVVDWRVKGGLDEHESNIDAHNQYLKIDHVVGLVLPDSTLLPVREIAFLADGSDYAVADYPKLMSLVQDTPIMIAQSIIDSDPEEYAANFGISADGLRFTVPNYPLKPHLAASGVFGVAGSTVEDHIQNMTGVLTSHGFSGGTGISSQSGVFDAGIGNRVPDNKYRTFLGSDDVGVEPLAYSIKHIDFDASRMARTSNYTEVNSSFLNFYIFHGESL
ncbi:hypothetical protein VAE151_560134 [Vibrio aestuarianus]|uniref:phage tail-collar fiber domain-containing protein n=1 Tax=Vibrio aestuarianus TaxID=28171 RepID=UPI00145611A9|nr:phage tail protein [Vibrio aestuarianus]NLS65207.1 hypothetical protein [Vibrio aestuarianus subsp. francensis]CAH8213364.1 hypothetical protein VAE151_560134 [Vibrio aestuarianus]